MTQTAQQTKTQDEQHGEPVELAVWNPSTGNLVIANLIDQNGREFLDVRRWFRDKNTDVLLPTRKGLRFSRTKLDDFMDFLNEARDRLRFIEDKAAAERRQEAEAGTERAKGV